MAAARGTSGSYYEDYMRSNAMLKHGGDRNAKQLLTDRNAYISFLEVQLERVSAACLSAQTFEKRLAELEATQIANDQKIGSLSKVFRLNQEYMEQTAEQSRSELTAFASKMDSWMEKYSTELQTHEARITDSEEHMRRTDKFVETLSCEVRQDLESLKLTVDTETQDCKTLVYALETRVETMQNAQGDADQYMDILRQLVTDRLDADLERIRTSLSEKYIAIEEQHEELRTNVKQFASEIETGWKTDLARLVRTEEEKWKRMRDQMDRLDQSMVVEIHEVKEFLRKCLDAQHLLSTTVVGLQAEVDEKKYVEVTRKSAKSVNDLDMAMEEIEEIRKNQLKLKEALRVVQSCSRDAQQTTEAQYDRLADRLEAAEQQFATLAHESLIKADEMRTKVLVALGEVEQKLRHDADTVAETAVQSVRSESKMYISQFLETVSELEKRVEDLEHERDRINVKIPTMPRADPTGRDSASGRANETEQITDAVARAMEKQLATIITAVRNDAARSSALEADLKTHLLSLEDRLNKNALRAEERSAIFSTRKTNEGNTVPTSRQSLRQRTSPGSSASSSVLRQQEKMPLPTKGTKSVAVRSARDVKKTATASTGKTKTNRLKEVCLDIVALEGSLKSRRRGVDKS